jgi:O-acetyl-ADP-ribose deacetylase (regulator of RNase III)
MSQQLTRRLARGYVGRRSRAVDADPGDDTTLPPMINYVTGNLFESPAQTLVNTVNTEGVMGKGIALQFKRYFPEMFQEYQALCKKGTVKIGVVHIYRTPHKLILNFPTKTTWRLPSKLEYIERGLRAFAECYQEAGIHSIAFPPLGCGNGELSYDDVRPVMERYLKDLPITVYLYPPVPRTAEAKHRSPADIRAWLRTPPRQMEFEEVWRDLRDLLATPRTFHTLTKQTPFEAELVDGEDGPHIRARTAGKVSAFGRDDVLQLWRDLRAHGIATSRSVDARQTAHLFPILAALPYIEAIQVADSFEKFSFNRAWGLQIVPMPVESHQQSLELAL